VFSEVAVCGCIMKTVVCYNEHDCDFLCCSFALSFQMQYQFLSLDVKLATIFESQKEQVSITGHQSMCIVNATHHQWSTRIDKISVQVIPVFFKRPNWLAGFTPGDRNTLSFHNVVFKKSQENVIHHCQKHLALIICHVVTVVTVYGDLLLVGMSVWLYLYDRGKHRNSWKSLKEVR
jgi:hypothetical protein